MEVQSNAGLAQKGGFKTKKADLNTSWPTGLSRGARFAQTVTFRMKKKASNARFV
jgi:hypothetical protein